ncbi:ABC transporter ATP-binding protein [Dactylosporangium sp. CA-233914]|uniref:ABC transporter ATP-binding protein n=1 Tax=Dactylosporangium sp. CA-233914 TaxID=3239934 RepID=UPI003D8A30A9
MSTASTPVGSPAAATGSEAASALSAQGLQLAYGDITAVWDASLTVRPHQVTVLLGHNGAGKSTLLFGLCGLVSAKRGSIRLGEADITRLPAWRRASRGIALVPEGKRVFRDLSVEENLLVSLPSGRRARAERLEETYAEFPKLADMRRKTAADLSGGQQQLLAIAQAVAGRPAVLLVDEPSSGLAPQVFEEILGILRNLRDRGLAILLVEQQVTEVLSSGVADQVVVMERGHVVREAAAASVTAESLLSGIGGG